MNCLTLVKTMSTVTTEQEREREARLRQPTASATKRRPRPCSASYIAVRDALYQLTRLNDFKTEKIGAGFFADVFKVTHKATGEVMVLKMNKNSKTSRHMLTEIQLMNRLSHPNILKFKGSCVHEGQLHALTEYINGGSLEDLLHNRSISLSWSVRVNIALDIAKGMAYLHSRGVFHRDLSSRNCLIQILTDGSMKCVVADFGLAAKIKESRRRSHTEVVGSPYWMAPECLNGKQYCEQADVFSYGIVLAETATRLPADPDFMPRTRVYGMDFDALHKMCLDCPNEFWTLMVRCCQIDPDERPKFDEAVRILERTTVPPEEEGREREELRACFSEPLLRIQDSDDNTSVNSGTQSPIFLLPPAATSDSLDSFSANSLASSLEKHPLEGSGGGGGGGGGERKASGGTDDSKNDDVFEDALEIQPEISILTAATATPTSSTATSDKYKTSIGQFESDEEGVNKGDSGIDPGEMFVAPAIITSYDLIAGNKSRSLSSFGEQEKCLKEEGENEENKTGGDTSTPCRITGESTKFSTCSDFDEQSFSEILTNRTYPTSATAAASSSPGTSPSHIPPTTPCNDRCCSPSSASDVSIFLPNPSTPWAPPPSPLRSQSYRLSSSLPSSPSSPRRKSFRFSMEVQEAFFPPFDPSLFTSPSSSTGTGSVVLRQMTNSQASKSKRRSLRHSCGHSTPLPTFPEDLETRDYTSLAPFFHNERSGIVNLDRERFSSMRRTRSASNPSPAPTPPQPSQYALNLARYSPCSSTRPAKNTSSSSSSSSSSAAFFKYYTIRPCLNCRLSSSEPNLSTCLSATRNKNIV